MINHSEWPEYCANPKLKPTSRMQSKSGTDKIIDRKHLDEGIKRLTDAVKEGEDGNTDAAKKAVRDAVEHFKQASK
ncbi:MAG: small metal-binding protein SmbP [Nitrosomonas sp.]